MRGVGTLRADSCVSATTTTSSGALTPSMTELTISAPDASRRGKRAARPAGQIERGSDEHLRLFCLELLETHDPFKPAVIDWPVLEADALHRLTSLPIWNIAVETEGRAGMNVKTFAARLEKGLLREAVEMDAFEESRHKQVLARMVEFYGIALDPEPEYRVPRDAEFAFMGTGYAECVDSFFAFGLFDLAKSSGFFPSELVETFEPVMREEGRHILFFVNWVPWWRRPWFELKIIGVWASIIWERLHAARRVGSAESPGDKNFAMTGSQHLGIDLDFKQVIAICLRENERRLAFRLGGILHEVHNPEKSPHADRHIDGEDPMPGVLVRQIAPHHGTQYRGDDGGDRRDRKRRLAFLGRECIENDRLLGRLQATTEEAL